jgi:hypothetical protein
LKPSMKIENTVKIRIHEPIDFSNFPMFFIVMFFVVVVNEIKNAGSHLLKKRGLYRAIYPHIARKIGLGS